MQNKWTLVLIFVGVFLLPSFVCSAPAPWGIALNHETKECSAYWAGDEFVSFELPSGWKDYYPDYSKTSSIIETEIGECNFSRRNEESCCEQLGYKYVDLDLESTSTGLREERFLESVLPFVFVLIILIAGIIFYFFKLRK